MLIRDELDGIQWLPRHKLVFVDMIFVVLGGRARGPRREGIGQIYLGNGGRVIAFCMRVLDCGSVSIIVELAEVSLKVPLPEITVCLRLICLDQPRDEVFITGASPRA